MKPSDGVPDSNEFGMMRSYLATQGFTQAWITATIGNGANGRSRSEITADLRDGLKVLPKSVIV